MKRFFKNRFWIFGMIMAICFSQCKPNDAEDMKYYMLVGTYTHTDSKGIYLYEFDPETGEASLVTTQGDIKNPSYLTIHGDRVYAVSETNGDEVGQAYAYRLDRENGKLDFLNKMTTNGDDPCYIETDKDGKFAAVANYSSGSLMLYSIGDDGKLKDTVQFIAHEGSSKANPQRQEGPHVHETVFSPDGRFLLTPDLGQDVVTVYGFNGAEEKPLSFVSEVKNEPGTGPRHIAFAPNGKYAYVIHELSATISVYKYDSGNFEKVQDINTWKGDFDGEKDGAELKFSADGHFLYASSRGDQNSISVYSVDDATGQLKLEQVVACGGKGPRDIEIDPSGKYLLAANQGSDNIVIFDRDETSGQLTQKSEMQVPIPVCIKFTSK